MLFALLVIPPATALPAARGVHPTPDAIFTGGGRMGLSVIGPGDVDGDGTPDLAVSDGIRLLVYTHPVWGLEHGGEADALTWAEPRDLEPDAFLHDRPDYRLHPIGDIDGDGCADLAAGVEGDDWGGGAKIFLTVTNVDPRQDLYLDSSGGQEYEGTQIAHFDDLDGDGAGELAISELGPRDWMGRVIFFDDTWRGVAREPTDEWTEVYGDSWDGFGATFVAADLTGDGADDLLAGAQYVDFAWMVDVASTGGGAADDIGVRFTGEEGTWFGGEVEAPGDMDGDGYGDVLVSAWGAGAEQGAVYLFSGQGGVPQSTSDAIAVLWGEDTDHIGDEVAAADLDGDGALDLAATDSHRDSDGVMVGWVFQGPIAGTLSVTDATFTTTGPKSARYSTGSLALPGDLDGDGWQDIAFGSESSDVGSGRAWLYYGPLW